MIIVGVDPGVTTGLCCLTLDGEEIRSSGKEARSIEDIVVFIKKSAPDVIVVEDFIVGRHAVEYKVPLKIIGVLEYLFPRRGIKVVVQSPSILYGMRNVSEIEFTTSPHIKSACMHALYYIKKMRKR